METVKHLLELLLEQSIQEEKSLANRAPMFFCKYGHKAEKYLTMKPKSSERQGNREEKEAL